MNNLWMGNTYDSKDPLSGYLCFLTRKQVNKFYEKY
jgi:hypothetical protein